MFDPKTGLSLRSGWELNEVVDEVITIDGLRLRRAGLAATGPDGILATGAAADLEPSPGLSPLDRARFELQERSTLLEVIRDRPASFWCRSRDGDVVGTSAFDVVFPSSGDADRWQYAKSNGVALARTWPEACEHAWLELCERDRILRSWYAAQQPARVDVEMPSLSSYGWEGYRFEGGGTGPEVAAVFGFPRYADAPLLRGFGAGRNWSTAVQRAGRECLQSLVFLWGEDIPTEEPGPAPNPMFHLDQFLWPGSHDRLRAWLDGRSSGAPMTARRPNPQVRFVDLAPGAKQFCVAKAICAGSMPLVFGTAPRWLACDGSAHVDAHPIA